MKAAISAQNLRAVTVLPVPTLPERNAVQDRPSRAIGRNSVSSRPIWSSRCMRSFGIYAKSRTNPSRIIAEAFSNMETSEKRSEEECDETEHHADLGRLLGLVRIPEHDERAVHEYRIGENHQVIQDAV